MDTDCNRRILIVDDNPAIHDDFRKVIGDNTDETSSAAEQTLQRLESLFGPLPESDTSAKHPYEIDSVYSGQEALAAVRRSRTDRQPYAVAFVDVRMPPGWDGIETVRHLWQADAELEVVICTAYSDYSWREIRRALGETDQLLILRKPFDAIEVQQLAAALTSKWTLARRAAQSMQDLEGLVQERTRAFRCALDIAMDTIPILEATEFASECLPFELPPHSESL